MMRITLLSSLCLMVSSTLVAQNDEEPRLSWRGKQWQVAPVNMRVRVDYQNAFLGLEEDSLAFLGTHLDFENISGRIPGLWAGAGTYSATDGEYGGLSTIGLNLGWRHTFDGDWSLEAGSFIGIGGGGSAPVGDSVMTRNFIGFEYVLSERVGFRIEKARMNFSDSDIQADDWTAGLSWRMQPWLSRPGRTITAAKSPQAGGGIRAGLEYFSHNPGADARLTSGAPLTNTIRGAGVRADLHLDGSWFGSAAAHAAMTGDVPGFHDFFIGLGHESTWGKGAFEIRLMAGSAGGGGVDTGGGWMWQPSLGYRSPIGRNSSWSVSLGQSLSSTSFTATTLQAGISFGLPALAFGRHDHGRGLPAETKQSLWSAAPVVRHMLSGPEFQMAGIQLCRPIGDGFEIQASTLSAANGLEGGYSEAWFDGCFRFAYADDTKLSFVPGLGIGIGGGSGQNIDGGGLFRFHLKTAWEYMPGTELQFTLGKVDAFRGSLAETYAELAWAWHFGIPRR